MPKARFFWPILGTLVLADCSTKELVQTALTGNPGPHPLLGDWLRVTLAYNPGAALNISLGGASRVVFGTIAATAFLALLLLYRRTPPDGSVAGGGAGAGGRWCIGQSARSSPLTARRHRLHRRGDR